jgi:purine nucleoside permease
VPESTESIPQTRNQNKTNYMKLAHCLIALALALFAAPLLQAQIPIKVVVVTTFENGDDITGNGEFQAWAANLPLPIVIRFPQGYHHLRYNPDLGVLGIVTGQGKAHAAASIMGLGMDPRFDLTHAYWIVAAIAGVDPKKASVASAAWANYVVDGDLAYEIDAREIPYGPPWSTGYVPFGGFYALCASLPGIQCQRRKSSLSAQHQSGQLGI